MLYVWRSVMKDVGDNVNYLEQIGLIEKKETARKTAPVIIFGRAKLKMKNMGLN